MRGALRVNSQPWSVVWLDGQELGRTPYRGDAEEGAHTLRLVGGDGTTRSQEISITAGEPTSICWDLAADAPCPR